MTDFIDQAETLRSTAKNLRIIAQKYKTEAAEDFEIAEEIVDAARIKAQPHYDSAAELEKKADEQLELAHRYETAANVLMQR